MNTKTVKITNVNDARVGDEAEFAEKGVRHIGRIRRIDSTTITIGGAGAWAFLKRNFVSATREVPVGEPGQFGMATYRPDPYSATAELKGFWFQNSPQGDASFVASLNGRAVYVREDQVVGFTPTLEGDGEDDDEGYEEMPWFW